MENLEKEFEKWRQNNSQSAVPFFLDRIDKHVDDIYFLVLQVLKKARLDGEAKWNSAVEKVEQLLKPGKKNKIDSCILWLFLYSAANSSAPDAASREAERAELAEWEAKGKICDIIIAEDPTLAFDDPRDPGFLFPNAKHDKSCDQSIHARCPARLRQWEGVKTELHFKYKRIQTIIFYHAAAEGQFALLRQIRLSIPNIVNRDTQLRIHEIIRAKNPHRGHTALRHAAAAAHDKLETMREVLRFPGIEQTDKTEVDEIFESAIKDGAHEIVTAFLEHPALKEQLVTSSHIQTAMKCRETKKEQGRQHHYMKIIKALVEQTSANNPLSGKVITSIVEEQAKTELVTAKPEPQREADEISWMDVWDSIPPGSITDTSFLLHLAVYHQSVVLVTKFLGVPESAKSAMKKEALPQNPENRKFYPLWYNSKVLRNSVWKDRPDDQPNKRQIRSQLIASLLQQTSRMQKLSEILHESGQRVGELCFDISRFNSKLYRVSDFVYSLINNHGNEKMLSYEETLRYAEFPALDTKADDREAFGDNMFLAAQHTEVFDVLDWLRDKKGVKCILELKVPDRLINAHAEERIAEYAERFSVESLDWRCLDLGLSAFRSCAGTADNDKLKVLHLYCSGRRAVIDHWFGPSGLPIFTKLERLYIHVVRETVTEAYCAATIRFVIDGLKKLREQYKGKDTCKFKIDYNTVNSVYWNPIHTLVNLNEIGHQISPRLSIFLKSLQVVVAGMGNDKVSKFRRSRVAIIDNGILSITPPPYIRRRTKQNNNNGTAMPAVNGTYSDDGTAAMDVNAREHTGYEEQAINSQRNSSLWSHIKDGRSFVDDGDKVSPWLFASDAHGTQMANLICAIDPFCELYVARVAEGRYGITPDRVARAIQWALDKEVDIISMSVVMLDPGVKSKSVADTNDPSRVTTDTAKSLEDMVDEALKKDVVIVCTTHDEGTRVAKSYPAAWKGKKNNRLIVATACDESGRLLHEMERDDYSYKMQGKNVVAGDIPFVESSDVISGSSVSTALAAGLSSLILTCKRIATLPEQPTENGPSIILEYLEKIEKEKHLILENFGGIDSTTMEGEEISASKILRKDFGFRPRP